MSGPTSNSTTTGNQLFPNNPNVGVPDSQSGFPATGQISLRVKF